MQFRVLQSRLNKAQGVIREQAPKLGENGMLELFHILNLFDCVQYDENGKMKLVGMTPVRTISLAAAMLAVQEGEKHGEKR